MENNNELTTDNEIFEPSIISIGNYEILFRDYLVHEEINNEDVNEKAIQYLNNAEVCIDKQLEYHLVFNPRTKKIDAVRFTMPVDNAKLSYVFNNLPWGIIKKNRTGIGATTLELKAPRNSIIVVPTRALAYEKAKNSLTSKGKYVVLYVGGKITGFSVPTIKNYLADNDIKYKKFIVVVDSLPTLLYEIGEDSYKDYFFMIDEIDSYQNDSWYRPNMEKAIDYYFKFPLNMRCMVSATIDTFTNPLIKAEPVIEVAFNKPLPRNITLQPTNNVLSATIRAINKLQRLYPNDKILVAFNAVTKGILPVIKSFPEEIQKECSVLCGEKSKVQVGDFYKEIYSDNLPSRISFMTCTYFVGIDIKERFHLISVATSKLSYTLLSTERLQQIAGRCRHKDGLLSETIIYHPSKDIIDIDYSELAGNIVADASIATDLYSNIQRAKMKFPKMIKSYNDISIDEIIEASAKSYYGSSLIKLVRETTENQLAIAYFNIDNILIQVKLKNTLYSTIENLKKALEADGNNVTLLPFINEDNDVSAEIKQEIEAEKEENDEQQLSEIIEELRQKNSAEEREIIAQARRNNATNKNGLFLEHFIELQKYVPFEELITILPNYDTPKEYKHLYNAILFWALADNHPIKIAWKNAIKEGLTYTGKELVAKFNSIWNGILALGEKNNHQAIKLIKYYFARIDRVSVRNNGKITKEYKVQTLNPLGIKGAPVNTISSQISLQRKIRM